MDGQWTIVIQIGCIFLLLNLISVAVNGMGQQQNAKWGNGKWAVRLFCCSHSLNQLLVITLFIIIYLLLMQKHNRLFPIMLAIHIFTLFVAFYLINF